MPDSTSSDRFYIFPHLDLTPKQEYFGDIYSPRYAPRRHARLQFLSLAAGIFALPLMAAFDDHLDGHGCGTGDSHDPAYCGGFMHCPEAARLWDLLPDHWRVVIA